MEYKELKQRYESLQAEIETYHLFYEEFNKYDLMISIGLGLLMQMYSSVIGLKKDGKSSPKIDQQESMIKELLSTLEDLQGLNNKNQDLKIMVKHKQLELIKLENDNKALKEELKSIKKAFQNE